MLVKNPSTPKFLDKSETCFQEIHATVYRELHSQGIEVEVCHAPVITPEEDKLWLSGVLSITSPKALQRCIFFYVGKCFIIRGGQEQRALRPSNFKFIADCGDGPNCVVHVEHGSKNRCGFVYRCYRKCPKVLGIPAESVYEETIPKYAFDNNILYLRPKTYTPEDPDAPWYENTLSVMVKEMCAEAKIYNKTNHSLCASGTTTVFRANVPEKIIQKMTDHRSIEVLRTYKRVSTDQQKTVSKVLMANASFENGEQSVQIRNEVTHRSGTADNIARILGDITNCTIGNITINVNPKFMVGSSQVENEFDDILSDVSFEY